jgi:hypothetical protein
MSETTLDQDSSDAEYAALLVGHTVTKVTNRTLALDDGTVLDIVPNSGCGGCISGDYEIDELNGCDNVITSASLVQDPDTPDEEHAWTLFVFANNEKINLLGISGDDGNGYYGTGFRINVKAAEASR